MGVVPIERSLRLKRLRYEIQNIRAQRGPAVGALQIPPLARYRRPEKRKRFLLCPIVVMSFGRRILMVQQEEITRQAERSSGLIMPARASIPVIVQAGPKINAVAPSCLG